MLHSHGQAEWVVCLIVFLLENKEYISIRIILVASAFFQIARSRPRFWTRVAEAACAVSVIKVAKF